MEVGRKKKEKDVKRILVILKKKTNEQKITATHTHTKYRKIIIMIETIFFFGFRRSFFLFLYE